MGDRTAQTVLLNNPFQIVVGLVFLFRLFLLSAGFCKDPDELEEEKEHKSIIQTRNQQKKASKDNNEEYLPENEETLEINQNTQDDLDNSEVLEEPEESYSRKKRKIVLDEPQLESGVEIQPIKKLNADPDNISIKIGKTLIQITHL